MTELVKRKDVNGKCTLTLNRPNKLNTLNRELFQHLRSHVDDLYNRLDNSILANSWFTNHAYKRLLENTENSSLIEGLHYEVENNEGKGPDYEKRIKSFLEKNSGGR